MTYPAMSKISNFFELSKAKGLKIVHLNIRSLLPKFDQIKTLLTQHDIDVLTISETWLNSNIEDKLVAIPGYTLLRLDRHTKEPRTRGGGLIAYITQNKGLQVQDLPEDNVSTKHLEAQWFQITMPRSRNIIICNTYRPPAGTVKLALNTLNMSIANKNLRRKDLFILGDLNINYKNKNSPNYKKLAFFESSNSLKQVINRATRTTKNTNSILDLILTNCKYIAMAGTLDTFISDHQPIFIVKKKQRTQVEGIKFQGRTYRNFNEEDFINNLKNRDWNKFYGTLDVDQQWSLINLAIRDELDKQCPVKNFRFSKTKPQYIHKDILEQMRNRDYFYRKAKLTQSEDDWNIAKFLRNQTNSNIRRARAEAVQQELENCKNDSSRFWRNITNIFPNKADKTHNTIKLTNRGVPVEKGATAQFINDFFINIGKAVSPTVGTYTPYHPKAANSSEVEVSDEEPLAESYSLSSFTETEVFKQVKALNITKSSGLSNISARVVRLSLKTLNTEFTHLLNTSITTNKFPDEWKKATVTPIPKKGNLQLVSNYRPISLLPTPGKVMEKLIHNQLVEHIENNGLLSDYQYGFRRNRSTLHAVTQVVNHVGNNLNKKIRTVAIFIDFKKAFDCLQFPVLITKLSKLGLHQDTVEWLKDYLTNRSQSTIANDTRSPYANITQGVPQGSILGPLLYIIYANDIQDLITKSKFAFYADDTVILSSHKNIVKAFSNAQEDIDRLLSWCTLIGIHINVSKTKYMIFRGGKPVNPTSADGLPLELDVHQKSLERVSSYPYLGVWLDEQINFNKHASSIIGRTTAKLYQLKKLRYLLNNKAALMIYKNMILPIVEYGNIYMRSTTKENRKKLQTLQNKALKCALKKDNRYNTANLHAEANIERLKVRRDRHTLHHIFQISQSSNFKGWKGRASIVTRSNKKKLMILKKPRTIKYQRSITYRGPKLWNSLPLTIQKAKSSAQFKALLIQHQNNAQKPPSGTN